MEDNLRETRELLRGLADGNGEAVQILYEQQFPGLLSFVRNNRGDFEDAKDLFQECLFYLFRYVSKQGIEAVENFEAYFRGMYRNRWYLQLNKRSREIDLKQNFTVQVEEDDLYYFVYLRAFEKLGTDCQKVLQYYIAGKNTEELALLLNTSVDYAKRKKYLCKENLKKIASQLLNEKD